jgi:hypothetical protein
MNGTKKLLFGLVTIAAMPGFADTNEPMISSGLEALFKANLQYRSESESDAVVTSEGREGVYTEVAMERWLAPEFAEPSAGRCGRGTAFTPWRRAGNQCLRVSTFAQSILQGSSKPRMEPEFGLMAEVMAFAVLKNTKRT